MTLAEIDLGLPHVATFPCNADKSPITEHGFKDAIRGMEWRKAPLVGFPTGAVNGVDVLDIDGDAGAAWYEAHRDAIPLTQTHSTRRGKHFLFLHAPGLRCSEGKIAPGVDVKAEGGYVIWWPREGFAVEDAEVAEWPGWLLEEARAKPRPHVYPSTLLPSLRPSDGDVASLRDALFALDPCDFRGQRGDADRYREWLLLMMACKAAGIEREDFVAWSTSDVVYRDDADVIGRKWDGVPARHSGALFAALSQRGIKYRAAGKGESAGAHMIAPVALIAPLAPLARQVPGTAPPRNLQSRSNGLIGWLSRNATGDGLFSAACLLAELGVTQEATTKLVKSNLPSLRRALGDAEFARQIARAYTHIEEKSNETT